MGGISPSRARHVGWQPGEDGKGVHGDSGEKYFGLVNVANTCYVNSVVQALYFCGPFRKAMLRHLGENGKDQTNNDSLLTSLAELFAEIECQKRTVGFLAPRHFLAKLRKANDLFCTSEHQDAHEFLQFLLNDILETATKRAKRQRDRLADKDVGHSRGNGARGVDDKQEEQPRTWVHDIFQGYLVNQTKCLCCENVTARREAFLDLSVDIERHTSIAECLRTFESTELLTAGNKFFCDMCGCLQEAEKRLRIYQLPSVLTLHLKRFKYVERLGRCCRLPYRVVFPLQLRIVEHRPKPDRRTSAGAGGEPGFGRGTSADSDEPVAEEQPPSRLFELRSVVVHIGRDSSRGHYVTVVRSGDKCVLLDDDVVRSVEPEVLRSFYGTAGAASTQYQGGSGGGQQPTSPGNGGWNSSGDAGGRGASSGGDRFSSSGHSSVPLYEHSPEGTCCGYLLIYEAVDGAAEHDAGSPIDVGSNNNFAADWISEERNLTDSDSGESGAEERAGSVREKPQVVLGADSEQMQAFEQRCIPRGTTRQPPTTSARLAQEHRPRQGAPPPAASASGHGGGNLAWTSSADAEGGRLPPISGSHSAAHGVRTLGSVVPAGPGSADSLGTISLSRVDVVTVPSPDSPTT